MRTRLYHWSFTRCGGGFRSIVSRQIRKQKQPLILRNNSPHRLVFCVESAPAVFPSLSVFWCRAVFRTFRHLRCCCISRPTGEGCGPADNPKLVCKTPVTVGFSVSVSDFTSKEFCDADCSRVLRTLYRLLLRIVSREAQTRR